MQNDMEATIKGLGFGLFYQPKAWSMKRKNNMEHDLETGVREGFV